MTDIEPVDASGNAGGLETESTGVSGLDVQVIPAGQVNQDSAPPADEDLSGYALLYNKEKNMVVPPLPKAHLTAEEANVYLVGVAGGVDGVLASGVFTQGPAFDRLDIPKEPQAG